MTGNRPDKSPNTWRTRDAIFVGVLAAAAFLVAFLLGSGLILATGVPATGGIANIFPIVFLAVVGFKICPRPFFGTLMLSIVFLLAIPTVIGGPLGPLKLLNGLVVGAIWDGIVAIGRRGRLSIVLASTIAAVLSLLAVYVGLILLHLPAVEKLQPILLPLAVVQAVLGLLASTLALRLYQVRVEKWPAVRRFQRADL